MTVADGSTSCFRHGHESHAKIIFLRLTWFCSPLARQDLDVQTMSNDAYFFAQLNSHTHATRKHKHTCYIILDYPCSCYRVAMVQFFYFSTFFLCQLAASARETCGGT